MKTLNLKYNPANEIAKYKFFELLTHSKGKDPKTVTQYVSAIHEFERATNFKDFKHFTYEQAIAFKQFLEDKRNKQTGQHISKSTYVHYIACLKEFFAWLATNQNYSKIKADDVSYFNVTQNDANTAKATNYQESYEIAEILSTIRKMPEGSILEKRNKAMISLCLLTTPRIASLMTSRIKSLKYLKDYDAWALIQNPKTHKTKYARNITAFFIGESQDIIQNIINWRDYLITEGYGDNDYLFPRIEASFNHDMQPIIKLTKEPIKSVTQIREAFKSAFSNNSLPYRKVHSFRHSMARTMKKQPNATELAIALAENIGHKSGMATIINSYGGDYLQKQADMMKGFRLE